MSNLCKECIDFFRINPPQDTYSLYVAGECEGCHKMDLVTNPEFFIQLNEEVS